MKRTCCMLVVLGLLLVAGSALANTVNVTGDLIKDGNLMLNVDWTVDTANYKGMKSDAIRKQVYEEIWKETLPQLAKKTNGVAVTYDKGNFTKVSELKELLQARDDGSRVTRYTAKVKFEAPITQGGNAKSEQDHQATMEKQYHYRFIREGID